MGFIRAFCWGIAVCFLFGAYKFYELSLSPYASSQTGMIVFSLLCAAISLFFAIKYEIIAWKDRKAEQEEQRRKQERRNQAMEQYKNGTWEFPAGKFYKLCTEKGLADLDNAFSLEKAKLLAVKILQANEFPVPEEYHHLYVEAEKLREYFQKGKDEVNRQAAMEKQKKEEWNRTPHKATPNEAEKAILDLAGKVSELYGIEKRRVMLNSSLEKLAEEIRLKKEGQEAIRQVGMLISSSATQKKNSDWAMLGGLAEGIAGPAAGVAVAAEAMKKNAETERWNRENRAAVNRIALDVYRSANDLNATIHEMETAKSLLSKEISALSEKVVLSGVETETLWNCLKVSTAGVEKTKTNVLKISTAIENGYVADVPENVHITVDGVLSAKVYCKDTLVGTTVIPLPLYGVECQSSVTFEALSAEYMEGNRKYKVVYEPIALWAMEL